MASLEEVQLAIRAGADAVGFVGPMPSGSHAIDDATAARLTALVPPPIARHVERVRGLTPANVAAAIRHVRPFGVDLCSGVRTDGRLDSTKLDAFINAVQRADLHSH